MLDRIGAVRCPCDLDLLLFFHRHPCTLLTSEQLVAQLGYERERVARSLDRLIEAGLLRRSDSPSRGARLHLLELRGPAGGLVSSLLETAATRQGRQGLMRLLEAEPDRTPGVGPRRTGSMGEVA